MGSNDIWKCPNCGTVNSGNSCRVCNTVCQGVVQAQETSKKSSNKPLLIALIAAGCILIVVAAVFVAYFFFLREPEEEAPVTAAVTDSVTPEDTADEEDIYYINKFTDSGIYVRSEPTKSSSKILYIKKGDQTTKLKYLGEKERGNDNWFWYMVETPDGKTGYVREDVVVLWEGDE